MSNNDSLPIIWSIAAVDSLSTAGCTADVQFAASLKVHCAVIATGISAQNSTQLYHCQPSSITLLDAQWQALAEQGLPKVVKIGALLSNQQINWLIEKIRQLKQLNNDIKFIFDPVIATSTGDALAVEPLSRASLIELAGLMDLMTPNIDEALWLLDITAYPQPNTHSIAEQFIKLTSCNVLLTGGDNNNTECSDLFFNYSTHFPSCYLTSPKVLTSNTRGTGCALSSLISAALANSYDLLDAICLAKAKLNQSLVKSYIIGESKGRGFACQTPVKLEQLPKIKLLKAELPKNISFAQCDTKQLGLYPVVDSLDWIEKLLKVGVKTLQLRIKQTNDQQFLEDQIQQAIILAKQYNARLFINDYWQLAIKHNAYGVHLGQEDLLVADLNAISHSGLKLGVSSHGLFEALLVAQIKPSYIALGHIFPTLTKAMPSQPQGLNSLALQVRLLSDNFALVAIGGIDLSRAKQVAKTGIGSIAVVTAITQAQNYQSAVDQLTEALTSENQTNHEDIC